MCELPAATLPKPISQAFLAKLNKADSSFPSVKKARTVNVCGFNL